MPRLIKVSDLKELINQFDNEEISLGKMAEVLEEKALERMSARGQETWGELESEYSSDEYPVFGGPFTNARTPWQWLETYYHPPIRKI